jgi:hypothetical protein
VLSYLREEATAGRGGSSGASRHSRRYSGMRSKLSTTLLKERREHRKYRMDLGLRKLKASV